MILAFLLPLIQTMSSLLKSLPIMNLRPCQVWEIMSLTAKITKPMMTHAPHSPKYCLINSSIRQETLTFQSIQAVERRQSCQVELSCEWKHQLLACKLFQ